MINIYCDESCHLENDNTDVMVLGGVYCPKDKVKSITREITKIKRKYNLSKYSELKWTKISNSKIDMYNEIIEYFFNCPDLYFRGLVIKEKCDLNHEVFEQSHDEWYYKMYYLMLKKIISKKEQYNIYLDIKDTQGRNKVDKLKDILSNSIYDFDQYHIKKIQIIRSHESSILQIADILIGALGYYTRGLDGSQAKINTIEKIKSLYGKDLNKSSSYGEKKFNIFIWSPQK